MLPLRATDPNQEAVEHRLAHNARGEFIEEDEMDARVARMLES
jgi:hypothetical protein